MAIYAPPPKNYPNRPLTTHSPPNAAVPEKGKFNFVNLSAQPHYQGLGGASVLVVLAPGALGLVAVVVLAVVSVALVVGADVSSCALPDLVRTENLSLSLSARLNLFRDPSAGAADEVGSVGCCWPDSLASCLKMAMRSWTGAWRVARILWTREW